MTDNPSAWRPPGSSEPYPPPDDLPDTETVESPWARRGEEPAPDDEPELPPSADQSPWTPFATTPLPPTTPPSATPPPPAWREPAPFEAVEETGPIAAAPTPARRNRPMLLAALTGAVVGAVVAGLLVTVLK
ncbi:MAG: hypothetical protein ACRDZ3_19235, partial [Acidimicrobiia bacterium]